MSLKGYADIKCFLLDCLHHGNITYWCIDPKTREERTERESRWKWGTNVETEQKKSERGLSSKTSVTMVTVVPSPLACVRAENKCWDPLSFCLWYSVIKHSRIHTLLTSSHLHMATTRMKQQEEVINLFQAWYLMITIILFLLLFLLKTLNVLNEILMQL